MMLDLSNFKADFLKKFLTKINSVDLEKAPTYISVNFKIPPIKLQGLLNFVQASPICYFKNRSGEEEFLALGKINSFAKKDLGTLGKILQKNPALKAFGGMRFNSGNEVSSEWNSFGEETFFLPLIEWSRENDVFNLKINLAKKVLLDREQKAKLIFDLEELISLEAFGPSILSAKSLKYETQMNVPEKDGWNKNVNYCLENFNESELKKVVLARKKVYLDVKELSPIQLFLEIEGEAKNAYSFYYQMDAENAFLSTSPERLFHIEKNTIIVDSIAGTRPRGEGLDEDYQFERDLKTSKKDLNEHRIVSEEIHNNLMGICNSIKTLCNERILKLNHVQHLQTIFQGILKDEYNLGDIISRLHPTPAVGGSPKIKALKLIESLENFDRGLYASPVGYLSAEKSEIAVGIRSALYNNSNLHVYGGAGIVPGSEGPKEWSETQSKMKNFLL